MALMPSACPDCGAPGGEPHVQPCSYEETHETGRSSVAEWLVGLHAEYARLKANARQTRPTIGMDGEY